MTPIVLYNIIYRYIYSKKRVFEILKVFRFIYLFIFLFFVLQLSSSYTAVTVRCTSADYPQSNFPDSFEKPKRFFSSSRLFFFILSLSLTRHSSCSYTFATKTIESAKIITFYVSTNLICIYHISLYL